MVMRKSLTGPVNDISREPNCLANVVAGLEMADDPVQLLVVSAQYCEDPAEVAHGSSV